MKIRIGNFSKIVSSMEEANKVVIQYANSVNLGKQQYITDAEIDGKQLIILGTSMVDDDTIEPIVIKALTEIAKVFNIKSFSNDEIISKSCDTGDLPKLKDDFIRTLENVFNVHIMYVWDEY